MFSAIAKTIRAILSGIENPVSMADIRASLDSGIFEDPQRVMELKKSRVKLEIDQAIVELERRVQSAKDVADHKAAQLLDDEKAAARKDDFALAKKLKAAREVSVREGE